MISEAIGAATRQRAIAAAQGREPFDRLLTGATVVDVATLELREADVGLVGEMIASVHPRGRFEQARERVDLSGRFIAPGLIDGHVHFESSHMLPHHYASVVVPQGTTTIFCDPHELANVLGLDGVRYAVRASRGLPLRFIVQASSCVPAAPGLELSGADFQADEITELLALPEVAGLAEVMDMRAVLEASPRMMGILAAAIASGKIIEGHARGLSGERLQAYAAAGISADHEIVSGADALEKLRAGLTVELRGSHDYLLPEVVAAIRTLPVVPTSLTVCTDDVFPDYLVEKGGMIDVLRRLIRYGLDPLQAIRCATINNAYRLRRDDLGWVAAGRRADLIVLTDLRELQVEQVYANGRLVASGARMVETLRAPLQALPTRTMKLTELSPADFAVRLPELADGRAVVRAIRGARFTEWSEVEVDVIEGAAVLPPELSLMTVVHRHGRSQLGPQTALIEGWGRWRGAYATSYAHDSHNLVVYGADPVEMALAANTVIRMGGGAAVVRDQQVLASTAFPVAGLLSAAEPMQVAREHRVLVEAAGEVVEWQAPYRTFKALSGQCLACNAGPHLTDLGLTDGSTREILKPFVRLPVSGGERRAG
jgi:adenine deaminase